MSDRKPAGRSNRSVKNLLLNPLVQVKLGLYSILLSILFALVVTYILYINLSKFGVIVMELTDAEEEMRTLFIEYMSDSNFWLAFAVVVFILLNIVVSVVYTHKLVGPSIAFNNHLDKLIKGDYSSRVKLRKGDAFNDTAERLNAVAEKLENGQ